MAKCGNKSLNLDIDLDTDIDENPYFRSILQCNTITAATWTGAPILITIDSMATNFRFVFFILLD
jgi:hypothetical protein